MSSLLRRPATANKAAEIEKRDSVLAPTTSDTSLRRCVTAGDSEAEAKGRLGDSTVQRESADAPELYNGSAEKTDRNTHSIPANCDSDHAPLTTGKFSPIKIPIPTDGLLDGNFMDQISFSVRGSVLLQGKKVTSPPDFTASPREPLIATKMVTPEPKTLESKTLEPKTLEPETLEPETLEPKALETKTLEIKKTLFDEREEESRRVRSLYEIKPPVRLSRSAHERHTPVGNDALFERFGQHSMKRPQAQIPRLVVSASDGSESIGEPRNMNEHELAGGIEDWEDVSGKDVDRYGFIMMEQPGSPRSAVFRSPQRVSTVLKLASETPRKRRTFGRTPSIRSTRSAPHHTPGRRASACSLNSQNTGKSTIRTPNRSRPFRAVANRLPGNQERRFLDEAGDMLTLPPGLADIAEDEKDSKGADELKKKEWTRTEKWRKMAKVRKTGPDGAGMEFEFDIKSPKLVERTWKGIPDRWRAVAWHSFLSASAKKKAGSATDEQLIEDFHRYLDCNSTDDVQIDIDVPRTINSHIMFRRRYRGGQRLLFRVLHSLSLYFPKTGYVQGMASLAATLLCYYDEEKTFVMLVRMWQLRGLDKLYQAGFEGLMAAIDEFQEEWLRGSEVAKFLEEMDVEPTSYGTRWYLTLFNYSIPFAAQLRVWDVFMLLGDADPSLVDDKKRPFGGGLDVLHATGAALIDGTREILLGSDFENAMKVLTSWIPIKDDELLMKVAKAEYKLHHGKHKN